MSESQGERTRRSSARIEAAMRKKQRVNGDDVSVTSVAGNSFISENEAQTSTEGRKRSSARIQNNSLQVKNMYMEESRRRAEAVATLKKTMKAHRKTQKQLDAVSKKLHAALKQNLFLNGKIEDLEDFALKQAQQMFTDDEVLQSYKNELDELQEMRDFMHRLIEEHKKKRIEGASSSSDSHVDFEFEFSEIEKATNKFDQSQRIVDARYESTFKGFLRHTEVAIKRFVEPLTFQREVNVLSKLRHPNVVSLIGACPDKLITVYEYLSGGTLEDRIMCEDNAPQLSWQNRIRIASELCSALIFLHSRGIVHGNLRPANILLDKSNVAKLSDFGNRFVLSINDLSSHNTVRCSKTDPVAPYMYLDPEFHSTGELTVKSDTFAFGIILLRLLTGKNPWKLIKQVKDAFKEGTLKHILDSRAGDWPFLQAQRLATLAMDCCDVVKNCPDLASKAWSVLESMRVSCPLSSFRSCSDGQCQIPKLYVCPIFQEFMQFPVIAADGFTYEADAIRKWLDGGHNTSPMTNLVLAKFDLVPNHALRSDIQGWLQQNHIDTGNNI